MDRLVYDWSLLVCFFDIKGHSKVSHLLGYGVGPKQVVISLSSARASETLLGTWLDSKLAGLFDHTLLDGGNDTISFLEGVITHHAYSRAPYQFPERLNTRPLQSGSIL